MRVFFTFFCLIVLIFLTSCSSSDNNNAITTSQAVSNQDPNNDNLDSEFENNTSGTINFDNEAEFETDEVESAPSNTENEELSEQLQNELYNKIRIKYNLSTETYKALKEQLIYTSTETFDKELFYPTNQEDEELYVYKYYDRQKPIVMSHIDIHEDLKEYQSRFFNNYQPIGSIKMISATLTIEQIEAFGAYIGANLILIKNFYEPTISKKIYHIIFLTGNTSANTNYWYRRASEAIKSSKTFEEQGIKNPRSFTNILFNNDPANKNIYNRVSEAYGQYIWDQLYKEPDKPTISKEEQKALERNEKLKQKLIDKTQGNEEESKLNEQEVIRNDQNLENQQKIDFNAINNYIINNFSKSEIYKLQKEMLYFRANHVIGLWQNIHTEEIIEIRKIPTIDPKSNNVNYGAYIVKHDMSKDLKNINEDNKEDKKNDNLRLYSAKINNNLVWLLGDLRFQFSTKNKNGFFLDEEKMVLSSKIYIHPIKGLLVVALPNNEFRYYRPRLGFTLISDSQYDKIEPSKINQDNIKRYDNELPNIQPVGNVFLYPGMTVGIITLILLTLF